MPSPNTQLSPSATPSPQEKLTNAASTNGVIRATKDELRNGFEPNGVAQGIQSAEPMQERKQKAKAIMAASGLSAATDGAVILEKSDAANGSATIPNGMVQTRKRSRSGTRILRSPRCRNNDRILKPRGPNDPNAEGLENVELHQYVNRTLIHTDARMYDGIEMDKLHDFKRDEADFYMALRGLDAEQVREGKQAYLDLHREARPKWLDPPVTNLINPAAIYGPGYGQYGKFGNGINQGKGTTLVYPAQRKRAGGKKTRELRVPRKELAKQSEQLDELVPIRLDIEWDKIRLRDTFTWNLHDRVTPPDLFAQQLVEDFKLPLEQCGPLVQQVSASLKEQIQDYHPHIFIEEEALDPHLPYNAYKDDEMRITIKLNITIGAHTLVDQFEWEINSPLNSPELFAEQMTRDLSLAGEFTTAIAHSIREQSQLFTRSLFVTGHPFDGRPVEDQELKAGFLPSPMQSPFRPYQAAKEFTPYLYELNEVELEKTELSLSREERRQKRSVNRRGGPALPDLKDRRRTIRTLVVSSVLPGAAETLEGSMIFKRTAAASGKGRRPGYGQKDGIDDSDESDSDESAPDSPAIPAHLLAGTARTRGMRGAATVAQAAMRGALGRSATPETTILHHHETRTSGRRFGGKDYREESVDDTPPSLIVKLRIHRDRLRQFMRDQKGRSKPTPLEQSSHQRSSSATPGRGTPAPGTMGPPTTPGVQQHQQTRQHGSPAEQRDGVNPLHPHAAQTGRVDAVGPPTPEHPMPDPPSWLHQALSKLQITYPDDLFEGTMRYTAVSTVTDMPISLRPNGPNEPSPPDTKFMYYPRIKCLDCPGKLYTPGPETGVNNFEVHLKNRLHRDKVEKRVREGGRSVGPDGTKPR
ncbi:hypothetical protein HO173_007145 [Letharia columbiana]|uniref:SNF5-domain-containing protein n=1 Tax=Letharia columbiana TaxID=112416 RepID=A0A8H6L3W1_9LECA|nr:uncharacterized protein HO173_007145 [Letharia columbiana]KAF6234520.1 hypothetical protein HO173_007145 [Letharia columbiana]